MAPSFIVFTIIARLRPAMRDRLTRMEILFAIALASVTGLATAAQGSTNAALGRSVGAVQASWVSFTGGLIIFAFVCPLFGQGDITRALGAQWWQLLAGVYGVYIVFMMAYSTPILGAALTSTLFMCGQLSGGMVVDFLGLLGTTPVPVSALRVGGCAVAFAGIALVYVGRKRSQRRRPSKSHYVCVFLAFSAGLASAIQTPTNAALASITGVIESSTVNFIVGFSVLLVATLIVNRGRINPFKGCAPWKFTGGAYGAVGVPAITMATPILGVSLALGFLMVAQLVGALLLDRFGWLETAKIPIEPLRILGALVLAAGIVLVTLSKM